MLLAGMFLAAFACSFASPVPVSIPSSPIPSPLCVVTAAISAGTCDPNKRRTIFDILYSCLGVIFLCTYIAIHHNILDQNDSWRKKTWLKVRTMLYAMLAPEVVIMWALRQRIMADEIASYPWNKERNWTRIQGFFVQMGGLMMREEEGRYRVVMWYELDALKISGIREREIMDHGKGDVLAKAIVVLQTSWFVAQCIARRVEGLVLTELELVTLAFAALNVVTYILWWDKPLNVGYPIYIDEEGNRVDGPEEVKEEAWYTKLWNAVKGWWSQKRHKEEGDAAENTQQKTGEEGAGHGKSEVGPTDPPQENVEEGEAIRYPGQGADDQAGKAEGNKGHKGDEIGTTGETPENVEENGAGQHPNGEAVGIDQEGAQEDDIHQKVGLLGRIQNVLRTVIKKPFAFIFSPLLEMTNAEDWNTQTRSTGVHPFYAAPLGPDEHQRAYQIAAAVGVVFGAIHLIGWNFPFSTLAELWLWRASSLVLTLAPALIPFAWRAMAKWRSLKRDLLFGFLVTRIGTPLYIAARVITLFLAFFALRDLPDSAYENVKWSNFIPHI